jgi:hypothetical protein
MKWYVERVVTITDEVHWIDGFSDPVFYDDSGTQYCVSYDDHWISCLDSDGKLLWTCGPQPVPNSPINIRADLKNPAFVCRQADGAILVSCFGNHRFFRIVPEQQSAQVLIDGDAHGLKDTGYGVVDHGGSIWVNEITGCRIWKFAPDGQPILTLGDGQPGFQTEDVPFNEVQFSWVYDIRCGPDGNIYVVDSRNFSVRMIDLKREVVTRIAGTGLPGCTGDGGDALQATFGSNPNEKFDGPWALSLDEDGNIFIGDMQNRVVRMVEKSSGQITTIAGRRNYQPGDRNNPLVTDPMKVNLPRIAGMNYFDGRLYVTQEQGDLVVLRKT